MYFWNSYPFVRFSIAFILGIICFDSFPHLWDSHISVLISTVSALGISLVISITWSFYRMRHLNGIFGLVLLLILGGSFTKSIYHSYPTYHYSKQNLASTGFVGRVVDPGSERTKHFRYELELEGLIVADTFIRSSGKIHIYVTKDSISKRLRYGDQLVAHSTIRLLSEPKSPEAFDYKKYLERQGIYGQSFIAVGDFEVIKNDPPSLAFTWAYTLREKAADVIDRNITKKRENGILKALLLGIRDHLENDIKKSYAEAGAMHVLAVSGLHVGLLYVIIQLVLGKLISIGRWGRIAFTILCISIIWFYAMLTGLSASVLRAATMFTIVTIGQTLIRGGNIYNSLGISALILLLFNPYLIYAVGFQLSYVAVLGIVYIQPRLYRLFDFSQYITDKIWKITTVSLAAQLATFPISAHYFHQFPTYFLLSNIVVMLGASILFMGGLFMLILDPVVELLSFWIGKVLYGSLWMINEVISWLQLLPYNVIEWIHLDKVGVIMCYIIGITFLSAVHFRIFYSLMVSLLTGILLTVTIFSSHHSQSTKEELIFHELDQQLAVDYIKGHFAQLYVEDTNSLDVTQLTFQVNPYRLAYHLSPSEKNLTSIDKKSLAQNREISFEKLGSKKLIFFDSTTFHIDFLERIHTDILIINNEAVKSLDWLNNHFQYDELILGVGNSAYYTRKMKRSAKKLDVKLHSLRFDGAARVSMD